MKKGDYNLHILIEKVKNLIEIKEKVLPLSRIKKTEFRQFKETSKMGKSYDSFPSFEHFYVDKTNLTNSKKILIEVYDNKHTLKNDYFGICEFDFGYG